MQKQLSNSLEHHATKNYCSHNILIVYVLSLESGFVVSLAMCLIMIVK